MGEQRAVSSVVGVVLLIALTVVLAGSIATFALNFGDELDEPGPYAGVTTDAEFDSGNGCGEYVRLTHLTGDEVKTSDMRLLVRVRGGEMEATIENLPSTSSSFSSSANAPHVFGDTDVIDQGGCAGGALLEDEWGPGTAIVFRVNDGPTTTDLQPGDEVEVIVVDDEADAVVTRETLTY